MAPRKNPDNERFIIEVGQPVRYVFDTEVFLADLQENVADVVDSTGELPDNTDPFYIDIGAYLQRVY